MSSTTRIIREESKQDQIARRRDAVRDMRAKGYSISAIVDALRTYNIRRFSRQTVELDIKVIREQDRIQQREYRIQKKTRALEVIEEEITFVDYLKNKANQDFEQTSIKDPVTNQIRLELYEIQGIYSGSKLQLSMIYDSLIKNEITTEEAEEQYREVKANVSDATKDLKALERRAPPGNFMIGSSMSEDAKRILFEESKITE